MDTNAYTIRVPRRWARIAMILGVAALIVAPLAAVATDAFSDVPTTHTHHNDITWLKGAAVTKGCNPPTNSQYCPDDNLTRAQMATFMRNFAKYLGAEDGTPAQADHATTADDADDADTLDGLDATDFAPANASIESQFTCAGTAHTPYSSSAVYNGDDSLRYHVSGTNIYRCNLALPQGAVVNSATYSIRDAGAGTVDCEIWRTNATSSIGGETQMVNVESSGTPGNTTITDNTVQIPTIDNENYSYFTQCRIAGTDVSTGLFAAIIDYTYNPNATAAASAEPSIPADGSSGE